MRQVELEFLPTWYPRQRRRRRRLARAAVGAAVALVLLSICLLAARPARLHPQPHPSLPAQAAEYDD